MVICYADQELVVTKPLDDAEEEVDIVIGDNIKIVEVFL